MRLRKCLGIDKNGQESHVWVLDMFLNTALLVICVAFCFVVVGMSVVEGAGEVVLWAGVGCDFFAAFVLGVGNLRVMVVWDRWDRSILKKP